MQSYIKKNIIAVLTSQLISKGVYGIAILLIIKYMSYDEYANYTFMMGLVAIISGMISSSINNIYIIGGHRFSEQINEILYLQIAVCILLSVAISFWFMLDYNVAIMVSMLSLAICLSEFTKTRYQQKLKFSKYNVIEMGRMILFFLFLLVYLIVNNYFITSNIVIILNAIALLMIVVIDGRKIFSFSLLSLENALKFIKEILSSRYKYLFMYIVILSIMGQTNIFFIKILGNAYDLAIYGVSNQFFSIYSMLISAVNSVFLPVIVNSKDDYVGDLWNFKFCVAGKLLICCIILDAFLAVFVHFYFAGKYDESIPLICIYSILSVVSVVLVPYVNIVLKNFEFLFMMLVSIGAMLLNVFLGVVLFLWFGVVGMAVSTLISYTFLNLCGYFRAKSMLVECI